MDVMEKLVELIKDGIRKGLRASGDDRLDYSFEDVADHLISNGVTVQEYGEWVHPKGYVVSNGFLCSKCGHKEASYYPINPRPGGAYIADEKGNFFYPPKLNYCPNCGAKMMPRLPNGE